MGCNFGSPYKDPSTMVPPSVVADASDESAPTCGSCAAVSAQQPELTFAGVEQDEAVTTSDLSGAKLASKAQNAKNALGSIAAGSGGVTTGRDAAGDPATAAIPDSPPPRERDAFDWDLISKVFVNFKHELAYEPNSLYLRPHTIPCDLYYTFDLPPKFFLAKEGETMLCEADSMAPGGPQWVEGGKRRPIPSWYRSPDEQAIIDRDCWRSWTVTVSRRPEEEFQIMLGCVPGFRVYDHRHTWKNKYLLTILAVAPTGPLAEFNIDASRSQPDRAIRCGDVIVSVNGYKDHMLDEDTVRRCLRTDLDIVMVLKRRVEDVSQQDMEEVPLETDVLSRGKYASRLGNIRLTENRGISLAQLRMLGMFVTEVLISRGVRVVWGGGTDGSQERYGTGEPRCSDMAGYNLYNICDSFVKPLTRRFKSSFVDLVSAVDQVPRWFISHWWGTKFYQTLQMLQLHSQCRGLTQDDIYWVCTFANNQHDLSELGGGLTDTPFVKVIMSSVCEGTVVLLDDKVTPFTRIWCVLENQVSTVDAINTKSEPHAYDMAAIVPQGSQLAYDDYGASGGMDGSFRYDEGRAVLRLDLAQRAAPDGRLEPERAGRFPQEVAAVGFRTDVTKANASRPEDRRVILHFIAGSPEDEYAEEPPREHPGYSKLNANTCSRFAGAMLRNLCGALYRESPSLLEDIRDILRKFPDKKDDDGRLKGETPAFLAAANGFTEALELLIAARADLQKGPCGGGHFCHLRRSPIFEAAQGGHAPVLKMLIEARVDVNQEPAPIHKASANLEVLSVLINARADVNPSSIGPNGKMPSPLDNAMESLKRSKMAVSQVILPHRKQELMEEADRSQAGVDLLKAAGAVSANLPPPAEWVPPSQQGTPVGTPVGTPRSG